MTATAGRMERRFERLISWVLRIGVLASLAIIVFGTIISFVHHPEYEEQPNALDRLISPGAAFPHTIGDVARGLSDFRGQAIVTAGLFLLIATPVLRVAVSILGFAFQRDWRYVFITSIVLALIALSFAIGAAEG